METKREYALDVLKIAGSLMIAIGHFQMCFPADYRIRFFPAYGPLDYGYIVELFFMLSGFFTCRYVRRIRDGLSFREFFLRRYLRLFPLMAVSAAGWFLLYFLLGIHRLGGMWAKWYPSLWNLAVTSLGVQEGWGFANSYLNHPMWYLSVLIFCYLLFYLLVNASQRLRISPYYLFGLMLVLGSGIRSYCIELPFLNLAMARGYCSFFGGVLLAAVLRGRRPGKLVLLLCALDVAVITALICKGYFDLVGDMEPVLTFLYFPAVILLFRSAAAARLFRSPVIGLLGKVSFNVFVWHMSGILIVAALWSRGLVTLGARPMAEVGLFALCCYLFGFLSHFCIEKPCARLTDRLLQKLSQQ